MEALQSERLQHWSPNGPEGPDSELLRRREEHMACPSIVVSLPAPPSAPRPPGSPNRRRLVCESSSESAASQGEDQEATAATAGGASASTSNEEASAGTVKVHPPKSRTQAGGLCLSVSDAPLDHSSDVVSVVSEGSMGDFQFKVEQVGSTHGGVDRASKSAQSLDAKKSAAAFVLGLQPSPLQMRQSLSREEVKLEHEEDNEVLSLAFSPDGSCLLAGGEDTVVVLWDVDTGSRRLEARMDSHVFSVAFAPSGEYFAAGGSAANVAVWRAEDLAEVGVVEVKGEVLGLAFAAVPRGVLAAGTTAKSVTLLSVPELNELTELHHEGYVRSVAFSPCAGFLAAGGGTDDTYGLMKHKAQGREMRTLLWQVPEGAAACRYLGSVVFDDIVHATAFSPSGKLLAVGGENCVVATLLVEREFEQASELECPACVRCLAWSPDSRFLATGGEDMQISIWDIVSERVLFQLPKADDWYCGVAFSADCLWLASCGYGSSEVTLHAVDLFNAARPGMAAAKEAETAAGPSPKVLPSPRNLRSPRNGEQFKPVKLDARRRTCDFSLNLPGVTALPPQGPMLRSPRDLDQFRRASTGNAREDRGSSNVVSIAEGFRIKVERVGNREGGLISRIAERQSQTAKVLGVRLRPLHLEHCSQRRTAMLEHGGDVFALAFSPDGCRMVAADEDATVVVWDVGSMSKVMEVKLKHPATSIAYSPSGTFIAAAGQDSRIFVWSTVLEAEVGEACVEGDPLAVALASSPTDRLAVGTTAKKVTLIAVPDMAKISELQHDGHVHSISFSPDGSMLAGSGGTDDLHGLMTRKSRGREMKALVWKVAPDPAGCGQVASILFGDIAHATTFSPSGKLLAVGGESRAIALLLVDRSFERASELPCAAGVRCLSWSADSRFLASGGEDMQVSVWDIVAESIVLQMPRAQDWICGVAFSSDYMWLATCRFGSRHAALHPIRLRNEWPDEDTPATQKGEGGGAMGGGKSWADADPDDDDGLDDDDDDDDEEEGGKKDGGAMRGTGVVPTLYVPALCVVGNADAPSVQISVPSVTSGKPGATAGAEQAVKIPVPSNNGKKGTIAMPMDRSSLLSMGTVKLGPVQAPNEGKEQHDRAAESAAAGGVKEPAVKLKLSAPSGNKPGTISVPVDHSSLLSMGTVKLGPVGAPGQGQQQRTEAVEWADEDPYAGQDGDDGSEGAMYGSDYTPSVSVAGADCVPTVCVGSADCPPAASLQISAPMVQVSAPAVQVSTPTVQVSAPMVQIAVPTGGGGKLGAMAVPTNHSALLSMGTVKLGPAPSQGHEAEEGSKPVASVQIPVPGASTSSSGRARTMALPTDHSSLLSMGSVKLGAVGAPASAPTSAPTSAPSSEEGGEEGGVHKLPPISVQDVDKPVISLQVIGPDSAGPKPKVSGPTDRSTSKGTGKPGRSSKTGSKSGGAMSVPVDRSSLLSMGSVKLGPVGGPTPAGGVQVPVPVNGAQRASANLSAHAEPPVVTISPIGSSQRVKPRDGGEAAPKGAGIEVTVSMAGEPAPRKTSLSQGQPSANRDPTAKKNGAQQSSGGYRVNVTSSSDVFPESRSKGQSLDMPWTQDMLRSAGTVKFDPAQKNHGSGQAHGSRCSPEGQGTQDGGRLPMPGRGLQRRPSNASIVDMGGDLEGFKIKVQQVVSPREDGRTRTGRRRSSELEVRAAMRLAAERTAVLLEHDDEVTGLAFSPDGKSLVAAGEDKKVVLWDMESHTRIMEAKMSSSVAAVAYGPSGTHIAAADVDGYISVWDTATHEEVGSATAEGDPLSVALTSKPRELLAVGSTAKKVMLLSIPDMEELADLRHDGHVHSVSFSPDGSMLAGGGGTDDMHGLMTRKADGREMKTVMWHVSHNGDDCRYLGSIVFDDIVHATAFSPVGKLLAVGGENRMIATFVVNHNFEKASELRCTAGVRCLAWSSDSHYLAEGGENMRVSVWDVQAKRVVLQLPKAQDWLCSLAFSRDGAWLASCGFGDNAVTLNPTEVFVQGPGNQELVHPPEGQGSDAGRP